MSYFIIKSLFSNVYKIIKMNLLIFQMPSAGDQVIGWMVTALGFVIVIISLIILFLIFKWISNLINYDWNKIFKSVPKKEENAGEDKNIAVAIAMALYLSQEVHDAESDEITITRIQRRYSPWSSKIYGLNGKTR